MLKWQFVEIDDGRGERLHSSPCWALIIEKLKHKIAISHSDTRERERELIMETRHEKYFTLSVSSLGR